jgi:hypothetical protein
MKSPAVELAKRQQNEDGTVTLSTGVRVRLRPIPPGTMGEARASIVVPKVPVWVNPDKDREEPNPNDPEYLDALAEWDRQRSQALLEVALMFGLELVDGVPEMGDWERNLQWLGKRGRIDLAGYDMSDPVDREFLYKKHCVMGTAKDWSIVNRLMGPTRVEVDEAADSFRGDSTG